MATKADEIANWVWEDLLDAKCDVAIGTLQMTREDFRDWVQKILDE